MADISDLPVPTKSADFSDLPVPPAKPSGSPIQQLKEKTLAEQKSYGPSGTAALKSAIESAGGAGGAYAGAELGAGLGAMTGPLAPVAVPSLGIAGGIAGYYGGEKLQEKAGQAIPESVKQKLGFSKEQREAEKKAHPIASTVGKYAPDVAAAGPLLSDAIKTGATTLSRVLPGATKRAQSELARVGESTDTSTLGKQMSDYLGTKLQEFRKARSNEAEQLFNAYAKEGAGKEGQVLDNFNNYLTEEFVKNQKNMTQEEINLILDTSKRLSVDKSITGLEKELRHLKDIANTPKITEGYSSIRVNKARDLAKKLEKELNDAAPTTAEKYREAYKEASEPVNLFDTIQGRKATSAESDPAALPNYFFKSKFTVDRLKQLSGDEKFVEQAARQHIASELKDLNPKEAVKWYRDNKVWLEELPSVNSQTKAYVDNLEALGKTQSKAKQAAYGAAALGGLTSGYYKLKSTLGL